MAYFFCKKTDDTGHFFFNVQDIKNVLYHVDMSKSLPNWTESNK